MKVDPRFLTGEGPEIFAGNELLLKGALEAAGGVHLLGGYPGSPIAEFFDSMARIKDLLSEKGIRAVINNNEALAAAMLNGSQTVACRAMIGMKSVGVHVAADALALGNLAGAHPEGGAIIVYGDDPWSDSTQVPADSRYISKHLHIPVVEPSDMQEVKDFVDLSFQLSARSELYVGYVVTTNLADGGGSVQCRPNQYPKFNTRQKLTLDTTTINLDKRVLLPPKTWWQEESLPDRLALAAAAAKNLGLNKLLFPRENRGPLGFVTSGLAHAYLMQALEELGVGEAFPVLKLGLSYPLDEQMVRMLAEQCERIVVVEERRGFLEEQIRQVLLLDRQNGKPAAELWGKTFPHGLPGLPATRGLHPSILIERLLPLLERPEIVAATPAIDLDALERESRTIQRTAQVEVGALPPRMPSFCPGCPHRDSASVCLDIRKRFSHAEYMRRTHKRGTVDLLFHGDTGCYTMLMFPPNTELMHDYSGMGLGGGTGAGTDPFLTNKEVVFMGDSTFFHSGQLAISQAVKIGQDITFIILDNSTTAMTGHQPTPGVDYDVIGNPTAVQDIEAVVNAIGARSELTVVRVDPEKRQEYGKLLEQTFLADGVKVVIADKECGITRMRRKKRQEREIARQLGYLPRWQHMNINAEVCRFCLACIERTGCPGLKHAATDYGRKMDTDITWCVDDGACERVGACSAFERVVIRRKAPQRLRLPELGLEDIPEPQKRPVGQLWRACIAGVGGMGIGVATSILVRAGHKEGYEVLFVDKKGLAIRNGGVVSQVAYNISHRPISATISYGKADLLLGLDILEAARALDPCGRNRVAQSDRTAAVINTDHIHTISGLIGGDDFDAAQLEETLRRHTRQDDFLARNISRICEKYLGSKQYANIMMLGFAFQKGLIPVSMHSMAWAIKDTIRTDFRKNLFAFNMGRKLVVRSDLFQGPPERTDWRDVLEDKCRWTIRRFRRGSVLADELRKIVAEALTKMEGLTAEIQRALVVRAYDCLRWGGGKYARRYVEQIQAVYRKDDARFEYAATRAAVFNLAGAMLIKDGVFLAELSTSPEKYARDREKYNVNPANGDRIVYRHLWHGGLRLGRKTVPYSLTMYDWMLGVLKRSRWLRKAAPYWHRKDRLYLKNYEAALAAFAYTSPEQYHAALRSISSPQCMNCLNPLCKETGCPLANNIPAWTQLAYQQRWQDASDALHERNNFPEFTAEICPALCQSACKQGLNGYPVQVQEMERQIIERAFAEGWVTPRPAEKKTGRRVAVVGSGPAGLAAAQQLARAGHDVTVFEKESAPGGLLRQGIPAFRLDKKLIDRRVQQLTGEGVQFTCGVTVGKDITGQQLIEQFDAVVLACGAGRQRDLNVAGRDRGGIHFALDYLRQANTAVAAGATAAVSAEGKIVAVVGGGLTGMDCVETALRQGAKEVHQFEILPRDQAPETENLFASDPPEHLHRRWGVATKAFGGNGSGVTDMTAVRVEWLNGGSARTMREMPGSEFRVKIDMAVLALGFEPSVPEGLAEQLGLAVTDRGRPILHDGQTSLENVFLAGDLATGPSYVVTAISTGRQAAERVCRYLSEKVPNLAPAPAV